MTGCGLRLWLRHPVRTGRAWLWLARQSAPAFDRANAERDRLRAARDAVKLALPGRTRAARRARAGVLRELNAGRLTPAAAVAASGLLTRPGVPELHRAALMTALGASAPRAPRGHGSGHGHGHRPGHRRGHGGGHPGRTPRPRSPGCGTGTRT